MNDAFPKEIKLILENPGKPRHVHLNMPSPKNSTLSMAFDLIILYPLIYKKKKFGLKV